MVNNTYCFEYHPGHQTAPLFLYLDLNLWNWTHWSRCAWGLLPLGAVYTCRITPPLQQLQRHFTLAVLRDRTTLPSRWNINQTSKITSLSVVRSLWLPVLILDNWTWLNMKLCWQRFPRCTDADPGSPCLVMLIKNRWTAGSSSSFKLWIKQLWAFASSLYLSELIDADYCCAYSVPFF